MRNTVVEPKMWSLAVLLAKQEVPAFSCVYFIDSCHFLRRVVSQDAELYDEAQIVITSCVAFQTGSASQHLPYRFPYIKFPGFVLF